MSKDELKQKAIQLKQDGKSLSEISKITGLSRPTIIRAYKEQSSSPTTRPGRPKLIDQYINSSIIHKMYESKRTLTLDDIKSIYEHIDQKAVPKNVTALLQQAQWIPENLNQEILKDKKTVLITNVHDRGHKIFVLSSMDSKKCLGISFHLEPPKENDYLAILQATLSSTPDLKQIYIDIPDLRYCPNIKEWLLQQSTITLHHLNQSSAQSSGIESSNSGYKPIMKNSISKSTMTHLQRLESESIHIMREVVAESDNPVMLYSIGKDSAVMLHLARKAFYPAKLPFPLLHVDTTWKFQDMYRFREKMIRDYDLQLIIHTNPEGLAQGVNPFNHGSQIHTDIMKTQALKQALDQHKFDVAFGGARRDEEKSRAKERIFSFRNAQHRWDPKNQRPELWNLYNTKKNKGESIRVFPLSNWTELDIWQYIYLENIPIVPLYFAQKRPVVMRDGTWIMVDDDRMPLHPGEIPQLKEVRFRTLGCYPLTGAIESQAKTLLDIIQEMLLTKTSERQGRVIDHDSNASMEKKKQEGYF